MECCCHELLWSTKAAGQALDPRFLRSFREQVRRPRRCASGFGRGRDDAARGVRCMRAHPFSTVQALREMRVRSGVEVEAEIRGVPHWQMVKNMNIQNLMTTIRRAIQDGDYEATDSGLLIRKMGVFAGVSCETHVNGKDRQTTHNLLPLQGLRYLLAAGAMGGAQTSAFYIAPFTNDVTPNDGWTAANFPTTAGEYTNYEGANRLAWTKTLHPTAASVSSAASPADFTLSAGETDVNLRGFAVLTAPSKGATTGTLISAIRHERDNLREGDTLSVRLTLVYQNAA